MREVQDFFFTLQYTSVESTVVCGALTRNSVPKPLFQFFFCDDSALENDEKILNSVEEEGNVARMTLDGQIIKLLKKAKKKELSEALQRVKDSAEMSSYCTKTASCASSWNTDCALSYQGLCPVSRYITPMVQRSGHYVVQLRRYIKTFLQKGKQQLPVSVCKYLLFLL